MIEDPWKDIATPTVADTIGARRVDADIPWGFFWARSVDKKYLLVLRHSAAAIPVGRLPRLQGIDVIESASEHDGDCILAFRLLDAAQRDIFHRLCTDIVEHAGNAASEKEAIEIALARTWRWHHFLRGGRDERLSPEEQKGLIGELLVFDRYLLANLSAAEAVRAWRGPLDAPKDFEIGRISIEAKARRGGATPFIAISSEHQLDDSGVDALFLHVCELDEAPSTAAGAFTLSDVARRVHDRVAFADQVAAEVFEGLLSAAGFNWEDDYSDSVWVEGPPHTYQVSAGFPRITPHQFELGVSYVRYSISLMACEPYMVDNGIIVGAMKEAANGN